MDNFTFTSPGSRLRTGRQGFNYRQGKVNDIFLFATACRLALGPTMGTGALPPELKRPEIEADHSLPSSAEVKNAWRYTSTPQYVLTARCPVKHRNNFTFTYRMFF
jgi:hypothetical protein